MEEIFPEDVNAGHPLFDGMCMRLLKFISCTTPHRIHANKGCIVSLIKKAMMIKMSGLLTKNESSLIRILSDTCALLEKCHSHFRDHMTAM